MEEPEDRDPALIGLTAGQAVVWYSGQFYALFFLTQSLRVDNATANLMIAAALVIGTPFFIVFGALSDKIGRKPIIMAGCLLAALTYFPVFGALTKAANPDLAAAQANAKVVVPPTRRSAFQGSPVAREIDFFSSCDIAKRYLAQNSVSYDNAVGGAGKPATITIGDKSIVALTAVVANSKFDEDSTKKIGAFKKEVTDALRAAGYPAKADPAKMNKFMVIAILVYLVILVTMVYGPIAAMLVELFHAHPLHLHEPAVPHRQRLVRRPAAHHRLRHRGADRQHVQRPLVPDHHCRRDRRDRHDLHQGNQGRGHLRPRLTGCWVKGASRGRALLPSH